jgi:hypothetical protein
VWAKNLYMSISMVVGSLSWITENKGEQQLFKRIGVNLA